MNTDRHMVECDVCGGSFQFGPNRYDGLRNQTYHIMVCSGCHNANWDGWAPQYESQVIKSLAANGTPLPQRNENGLLPRE